jgi:hypothetical protein
MVDRWARRLSGPAVSYALVAWYVWFVSTTTEPRERQVAMDTKIVRVPITAGSDDYVEVEIETGDEIRLNSARGAAAGTAVFSLLGSFDKVVPVLSDVVSKVRSATHAPDEVNLELGLKVGGETGLVFCKGTGEANFVLKVKWAKLVEPDGS